MKKIILLFCLLFPALLFAIMPPRTPTVEKLLRGEITIPVLTDEQRGYALNTPKAAGTFKAVVLLVDFPDQPSRVTYSFFPDLFNSQGIDFKQKYPITTNLKSIKEYFAFVSDGKYDISFDIFGWYRMPQNYSYYVGSNTGLGMYPQNSQKMTEDAIQAADKDVDFSKYDNDSDGSVDFLLIVHAGSGGEFEGDTTQIWSHQWQTSSVIYKDGKALSRYCTQPEYWVEGYDMTIGVYVHELGHLLFNLPDLYDIYYTSRGIGYWGLMGSGSWNDENSIFGSNEVSGYGGVPAELTAWSKIRVGWVNPTLVTANEGSYTLQRNVVLKFPNPQKTSEYFLVEYKNDNVFNRYMPAYNAVLIYHVDDYFGSNVFPWKPGDNPDLHYKVAIEQKDALWELEKKINRGDAQDVFYSGDAFTNLSVPSSDFYSGDKGISIPVILISGNQAEVNLQEGVFKAFLYPIPGTDFVDVYIRKDRDTPPFVQISSTGDKPVVSRIREKMFQFRVYLEEVGFTYVDGVSLAN